MVGKPIKNLLVGRQFSARWIVALPRGFIIRSLDPDLIQSVLQGGERPCESPAKIKPKRYIVRLFYLSAPASLDHS